MTDSPSSESRGRKARKLAPELTALYDEYAAHRAAGRSDSEFRPRDPALARVIENRVLIDAVASGDADLLKSDLVALGMRDAVAFGRMISGQLPIAAIPAAADLPTLQFARAAAAATRGQRRSMVPPGS